MTTDSLPDDQATGLIAKIFASRAFLDSFADGLIIQDLEGRIVDANVAASELLGVEHDQLLGRTSTDASWHAIREDASPFADEEHPSSIVLRTRQPSIGVVMGIAVPGRGSVWFSVNAYPIEVDGELVGVSSLLADVSSEVQTRQELRDTTDHLRILAQYPADIVVLASEDAVGQWCSDSVTELMGWQPDEVVGKRIDSFVHPDDLSKIIDYRRDAPDASTAAFLVRLRNKAGDYRWISISARRFFDPVTHESRIVSSWRDAQSLVETRQRLEASEARFHFLAENASDVVGETDPNFNFTWVSASVFDILGWRPEQMVGKPTADFIFPDDLPAIYYERANVEAGLKRQSIRARFLTSSGSVRWMIAQVRANVGESGSTISNMISLHDVHEEEMVRREFAASEERYRLLAENASDLIILLDADDVCRWVSPSSMELFGWRPEEMLGKRVEDFAHYDDLEKILGQRERPSAEIFSVDAIRFRRADGEYTWVSGRGRNVRNSYGELTNRIMALRDVTSQVVAEQELARSEALFRLVLENQMDVTARLSQDGSVEWITPSVFSLVGWQPEEVAGRNISEFVNTADIPRLGLTIDNVTAGLTEFYEARILTVTGEEKWVATNAKPLFNELGETTGSVINVRDISVEHATRTQLARSERLFRLALESAPIGIAVLDLERRFLATNPVLGEMVGRSPQWLLEHGIADVLDPDDDQLDRHMRAEALSGRVIHAGRQERLRRPDATLVWVEHAIGLLRDESGTPLFFVSTFVDVTESRAIQEKLRFQATHDTLTQLVNRRDLYLRAESLQRRRARTGEHVGVLYIDIDGFKVVNDTFGHYVGDVVLKAAAERLAAVGRKDDVVSRVGGDEFVILLPALHSLDDAVAVANTIVEKFREPISTEGVSITLGVSVGVALALDDETADGTLRRADAALYEAKMRGRGQAVPWSPDFA
jgi:diguanylate cyclase (GGDEF)-like protein/PAS domain S-box-containing protein